MRKIALVFPGQGSQYLGMGEKMYHNHEIVKRTFEEASDILQLNLKKLCFGDSPEINLTSNTQPAILTVSVAYYRYLTQLYDITPSFLAGHSLGEISALTCSNAIHFEDALRIVRRRGLLMQEADAGGTMASIHGMPSDVLLEICQESSTDTEIVILSNYNSLQQSVISGHHAAVSRALNQVSGRGFSATPLSVSSAFHSPMMRQAAEKFRSELENHTYLPIKYPVLSNVSGFPYLGAESIAGNLFQQMTEPVQWLDIMNYLIRHQIDTIIEIGPKSTLKNLFLSHAPSLISLSIDMETDRDSLARILRSKRGYELSFLDLCMTLIVTTRNNNWDQNEYESGVAIPYKRLLSMQGDAGYNRENLSDAQYCDLLDTVISILTTKKVPVSEQKQRIQEIALITGTERLLSNSDYLWSDIIEKK
ncbi:ACP S-malonyltransferase [Paenibacillus sp. OSY-SE]|uniref:ACP S-malonyltransferase n=1 Tax=Paenibacillus sp. OSY-SE TaxID=1196323 RepID=UPI0002FDDD47|nr:ACP S-malonyltransferase [Paenibacillus sp. OSY-SE]